MSTHSPTNVPIRVSAKTLGSLALPDHCDRCFWLRVRLGSMPYAMFPSIFSRLDAWQKRLTSTFHHQLQRLPDYLWELGDGWAPVKVPHHSRYFVDDPTSGIRLTGAPDDLLRRADGTMIVLDYKTATIPIADDPLSALYSVQVNAYAWIAERLGIGTVAGAYLVYFEPRTAGPSDVARQCDRGPSLSFKTKLLQVPVDDGALIPKLLLKASEIVRRETAPIPQIRCKDCVRMGRVLQSLTSLYMAAT